MDADPLQADKHVVRDHIREALTAMTTPQRAEWSRSIVASISKSSQFMQACTVMSFLPADQEPDISPIVGAALDSGKQVALPRMDWDQCVMEAVRVNRPDFPTEVRRYGIEEPLAGPALLPTELDLILVPGLAFTSSGDRLGRGGGYYDRYLARTVQNLESEGGACRDAIVIGVCFAYQLLDNVPAGPDDQRMDAIVTERGLTICEA